jgi:hypothetical protein
MVTGKSGSVQTLHCGRFSKGAAESALGPYEIQDDGPFKLIPKPFFDLPW